MKNYWKSYAIIACSAILIACSTNEGIRDVDSGNVQNTGNIESEINANLILVNYMHVVDSCVVLNLSQKEAEALGVSDYYYQKAQKTVLEVNKAMKESIKEHPDWPVLLCLQLADLSPFAIALCFGNNDAQIVAQRKYRMKSKME